MGKKREHAVHEVSYGPLVFAMSLPVDRLPAMPEKAFFRARDIGILERAAALWIIEHGVTRPEAIRALRAAAGLSGTELAGLLGVDKAQVSRWESGKHDPGVAMWNLVADLALEKMKKRVSPRARLAAVKTYRASPMRGTIKLAA